MNSFGSFLEIPPQIPSLDPTLKFKFLHLTCRTRSAVLHVNISKKIFFLRCVLRF